MNKKIIGIVIGVIIVLSLFFMYSNTEKEALAEQQKQTEEFLAKQLKDKEAKKLKEQQKIIEEKKTLENEKKLKKEAEDKRVAQEKELEKNLNIDTYSNVYDDKKLNIFIDDYIINEINNDKLNYVVNRIKANISNATVTVKKDKNEKAYMEITPYVNVLNLDTVKQYNKIDFKDNLNVFNFEYNQFILAKDEKLDNFFQYLDNNMQNINVKKIVVVGHTDSKGSENYNLFLSYKRAIALNSRLEKYDVDTSYIAKGESEPVASNKLQEGRDQNRRIEVQLFTK